MIVHDSDVDYNTRHDCINMHFNFNTSAKLTTSTTVELSGSQHELPTCCLAVSLELHGR